MSHCQKAGKKQTVVTLHFIEVSVVALHFTEVTVETFNFKDLCWNLKKYPFHSEYKDFNFFF